MIKRKQKLPVFLFHSLPCLMVRRLDLGKSAFENSIHLLFFVLEKNLIISVQSFLIIASHSKCSEAKTMQKKSI